MGLYDGIEVDAALRPLFGADLATERESQKRFFTDWADPDMGSAVIRARRGPALRLLPARVLTFPTRSKNEYA
jgi:truncated hemoglobin YjbI